jgi:hypothetical protein
MAGGARWRQVFARAALRDCEAAQAVELARALRHQLHEMTTQLARVERQDVTGRKGRAVRMEAAELRRDLKEAQMHIDRLQRRYLSGDARTRQRRPAGGEPRVMVDLQAKQQRSVPPSGRSQPIANGLRQRCRVDQGA